MAISMNVYKFKSGDYTGYIKGVNGVIIPPNDDNNSSGQQPSAESCSIEIVESGTFRVWQKVIKKEDLDGTVLKELYQLVMAIEKALDDNCKSGVKTSLDLRAETDALTMILCFPSIVGEITVEFLLYEVEQDQVSVLQKQVKFLTEELKESKAFEMEMKQKEKENVSIMNRRISELQNELNLTKQKVTELSLQLDKKEKEDTKEGKFVSCGSNLHISECGKTLSNAVGAWRTAVTEETMVTGKYYAEFQTLRMNGNYNYLYCGIVPSTSRNLNLDSQINGIRGGFCYYVSDGNKYEKSSGAVATGLPSCNGVPGPMLIGVKLDLDENKIQFFLNGRGSTLFNVPPGKYNFAVSLYYQWDAAQLIRIKKLN